MNPNDQRILLVEDDSTVLGIYLRALRDYQPMHAEDGIEARKILSETEVDVVLCDLEMPRMNGLELMRWAKEHCPHPLWIVVSGQDTFAAATQALKLGAFDYISKPIQSSAQLQTAVANALRQQALVAERALLVKKLTDSHRTLQAANDVLREQQATLEQDLRRAEQIVQALLPRALRPLPRMQVNVAYRPSKSIGGDFYGSAMLDDRYLALYVADAAGHGVSAALLAVLFNQRLSVLNAERRRRAPGAILGYLNRGLLGECRASGLFVTAVYAVIDTSERTATIASAGHPPAIILRSDGGSQHLEKTGPALGLSPEATYTEHRVALADGDCLLLYTDGLTGGMSQRAPSLDATLASAASHGEDGRGVIDLLLRWFERDDCPDDDMTLLLLTAMSGGSTFDADQARAPRVDSCQGSLAVGSTDGATCVAVRGRATWKEAALLRDTCIEALAAGRGVVVDLASCTMLDSTILGTLHELVARSMPRDSLRLQNASVDIRGLFAELSMNEVLSSIAPIARPTPVRMVELRPKTDAETRGLVLHAHELLAELSASNAEQFQPVIEALQREARQ